MFIDQPVNSKHLQQGKSRLQANPKEKKSKRFMNCHNPYKRAYIDLITKKCRRSARGGGERGRMRKRDTERHVDAIM